MTIVRAATPGAASAAITELVLSGDAADNTAALITAAAAVPASGGVLSLRPGAYPINATTITGRDGLVIDGAGAVLTCTSGIPLTIQGTRTSGVTTVTANIAVGANTIAVASAASLSVGDLIAIRSSAEVFGTERLTQYFKGELARIAAISGTTVTLASRTYDSYATSSGTISVDRIVPVRNVTIRNLRIVGGGTGQAQSGVQCFLFDGATVENVTVDACERTGILGRMGVQFLARGNRVTKADEAGLGYGVRALGVDYADLVDNTGRANRHTMDADWELVVSRNVRIAGNIAVDDSSAGISTHGGAELVDVDGNFTRHCGGGVIVRSGRTTIRGNHISGTKSIAESSQTYLHGISLGDDGTHTWGVGIAGQGLRIINNHIDITHPSIADTTNGIYGTVALKDAQIIGNQISGSTAHGMRFKGDWVDGALIADNVIDCTSQAGTSGVTFNHGIYIAPGHNTVSGNNQKRLRITGNDIRSPLYSAIRVDGNNDTANRSDDIVIAENVLRGFGLRGVDLVSGYFAKGRVDRNIYPATGGIRFLYVLANWTSSPEATAAAASSLNPTVYDTFTGKADADLSVTDSGHTYTTQNNVGAGGAPAIRSGLLTFRGGPPGSGTAATYAVVDLGTAGTHIGGAFRFGTGATTETGSAVLVLWSGAAGTIPNSTPCHLVTTPNYWELGVFVGATFTSLSGQRFYASALPLATTLRMEAVVDQSLGAVHILLPDGSTSSVRSPMIRASATGRYACWENYLNVPTDQVSGFSEIWADAVRPTPGRAPQAAIMDVLTSQGLARPGYGTSYTRPASSKAGGQSYWDTTLGKQVVSTGTAWVDPSASNAPVGNLLSTFMATNLLLAHSAVSSSVTLAVSRAVTPPGRAKVLQITGNASGTGEFITSPRTTGITAGQTYSGYVRNFYTVGTARTFKTRIYWWNVSDGLISTSTSTGKTSTSGGWTTSDIITATAPSLAVSVSLAVVIESQAAAGEVFYATEFCFAPGTITDFIEV